jgi:hypothetical protein
MNTLMWIGYSRINGDNSSIRLIKISSSLAIETKCDSQPENDFKRHISKFFIVFRIVLYYFELKIQYKFKLQYNPSK